MVHLVVTSAIGERVGGYIEDAHEGGTVEDDAFILGFQLKHLDFFCKGSVFPDTTYISSNHIHLQVWNSAWVKGCINQCGAIDIKPLQSTAIA